MPQETEQRRLSTVKSMQNIIHSIIYDVYTREFSTVGEVGLKVILNIAFILFSFSPMP
jgi:hypothetical protein